MKRHWAACVLLLAVCSMPAWSLDPNKRLTQYVHRIWQLSQGLPDATITSIVQTGDGYLWLGTETGLVRFDGVRFGSVDDNIGGPLRHNWVREILKDGRNGLWIGTNDAGLIHLENGAATQYAPAQDLEGANVQCIVAATNGELWACTTKGIARLVQGKLSMYRANPGPNNNNFRDGCAASDGTVWFGGDDAILTSWNGSEFSRHTLASLPSYGSIRALMCSKDGSLWIGTTNGLIRYQGGKERRYAAKDGLADDWVYCLLEGSDHALWIGTKNGFSRFRGDHFESFRTEDGLSQSTVYSLYEDREGSLWVGTKHGLNQFLDGRSTPYTVSEGLPSNHTGPILQDHTGTIWIGTLGAGLCRFEEGRCSTLTVREGLAGNSVYSLAEDNQGGVWVGTDAGLSLLRNRRVWQNYTTAEGLPANRIRFLARDHEGGLWVGTSLGLTLFRDGKFIQPPGVRDASLPSILGGGEDAKGNFIAATEAGASLYRNGQFAPLVTGDTPLREVDTLYADPEGLVWMGTFGSGLRMFDGKKATAFFMRDGLFDNDIYGIVLDNQDRLWMASSKGIFSVRRTDLRKFANGEIQKVITTPYSPLDGLRTIECQSGVQPAVWRMNDGRIWFSTIKGVLILDPARLPRNSSPPPVVVDDVTVNGQIATADQISRMQPGRKDLEFGYTALSFLNPAGVTFRYKLDGYDTAWVDAGTRRVAYYTNLPPGDFHFHVTACNSDGVCNQSGTEVAFSLARHYYQRPWFFPLCVILAAAGVWVVWRRRVQGLRKHFEIVLAERSRIARELHDTLIQGFSGITMGMQAVSIGLPPSEEQSQLKELIHDAANSLKQARQSVADLRGVKDDAKETAPGLAESIAEVASQITRSRGVDLNLRLDEDLPDLGAEVEYNLLRIVQEAVSNSVKHSGAANIEVALRSTPELVALTVRDDGQGFTESEDLTRSGHYGLAGMRERAEEIGAEFELTSAPAQGTTIRVWLPRTKRGGRPKFESELNQVR